MTLTGIEQRFHPDYTTLEKAYIRLLGVPVVGLRIRARNIMQLIPRDTEPREVLDVGSGPGVISFLLARRFPSAQVTGVDMLDREISNCRKIAERAGISNVAFIQADARQLQIEDRFDLATCVDILEHIEDDRAALRSVCRALAPGGRLVLHVPALYRRFPVFKRRINFDVPTHVRPGYEPAEIEAKVRESGFEVEDAGFTYGFLETFANNMSYLISRARKQNKAAYAVTFPVLNAISWLGRCRRPSHLGAGVYVVCRKP